LWDDGKKYVNVKGEYLEMEREFGDSDMLRVVSVKKLSPGQPSTTYVN
jgi:hypothetical protein